VRIFRVVSAVLLVAALLWAVAHVSETRSTVRSVAECSSNALSQAVNGAFRVMSVQNFGCAGDFAYLWATVGTNEADAIGVTEVLKFRPSTQHWVLVSREKYCHPSTLPAFIYKQGCFSN